MGDPSYLRYVPPSVANIPIDWSRVPQASKEHALLWARDWRKGVDRPLPATIADLAKWFDKSKFFGYFGPKLCTLIMDISEYGLKPVPKGAWPVGPRFYMKYLEQVWYLLFSPGERDCILGYSHDIIITEDDEDMEDDDEVMQDEADNEVKGLEEEAKEHDEKEKGDEAVDEDKGPNKRKEKDGEEVKKDKEGDQADEGEDEDKDEEDDEDYDSESDEPGAAEEVVLAQEFDAILERDVSLGRAVLVTSSKQLAGWSASTVEDSLTVAQYGEAMMTLPLSHPALSTFMSTMLNRY